MKDINLKYIENKIYIPFEEHYEILREEVKEKIKLKEEIERLTTTLKEIKIYIDSITWNTSVSNIQDNIWYLLDKEKK